MNDKTNTILHAAYDRASENAVRVGYQNAYLRKHRNTWYAFVANNPEHDAVRDALASDVKGDVYQRTDGGDWVAFEATHATRLGRPISDPCVATTCGVSCGAACDAVRASAAGGKVSNASGPRFWRGSQGGVKRTGRSGRTSGAWGIVAYLIGDDPGTLCDALDAIASGNTVDGARAKRTAAAHREALRSVDTSAADAYNATIATLENQRDAMGADTPGGMAMQAAIDALPAPEADVNVHDAAMAAWNNDASDGDDNDNDAN